VGNRLRDGPIKTPPLLVSATGSYVTTADKRFTGPACPKVSQCLRKELKRWIRLLSNRRVHRSDALNDRGVSGRLPRSGYEAYA
jgi:hypothetical protein